LHRNKRNRNFNDIEMFFFRATSDNPLGPFEIANETKKVREVFSHNPTVFTVPTSGSLSTNANRSANKWVLAQIGCGQGRDKRPSQFCQNGSTPGVIPSAYGHNSLQNRSKQTRRGYLMAGNTNCDNPHFCGAASAFTPGF
jgi:hypothetical protein